MNVVHTYTQKALRKLAFMINYTFRDSCEPTLKKKTALRTLVVIISNFLVCHVHLQQQLLLTSIPSEHL